jgi:F-type H+-transporting ATPase subunit alpha
MPVERQVIAIFAGTKGYVDDLDVDHVQRFRDEFLDFVESAYPEIGKSIVSELKLTDENAEALGKALTEFKAQFAVES